MHHSNSGRTLFSLPSIPHRCYPRLLLLLISLGVLTLAASQNQIPQTFPIDNFPIDASINQAIVYLYDEYNPELALLRESPETAPHKHWLMTDNWLAAIALGRVGETGFATQLCEAIKKYGLVPHGLVEAVVGDNINWPPKTERPEQLIPGVKYEIRDGDEMLDWSEYSDLALYAALYHHNLGHTIKSRLLYNDAIKKFDGLGFADKAQVADEHYATYKLALTVYVANLLQEPVNEQILRALLDKQLSSGGFSALYNEAGQPVNDSNTETTAYALLALSSLRSNDNQTFSCEIQDNQ
jgi:hypothetical protein